MVSSDLVDLTQREINEILCGEKPSADDIRVIGGGKETDDSVRRRYVISTRDYAWRRLQSQFTCNHDKQLIKNSIDELDAFIADLPLN